MIYVGGVHYENKPRYNSDMYVKYTWTRTPDDAKQVLVQEVQNEINRGYTGDYVQPSPPIDVQWNGYGNGRTPGQQCFVSLDMSDCEALTGETSS